MSFGRRTTDRRRRVLYSAGRDENLRPTAASRRETQRLREARRPVAAYGSRVHRRLRGRWFSLVPVRRRTITLVAGILVGLAVFLCFAHYGATTWPSLAYRAEIARPLRLDRPDSFGRLFTVAMIAGCAGASLLIYQLRRYRNDDYQGRYRLWRLVLAVMVLTSINSLVSLVDWGGALLDWTFGKRVALAGGDWLQIVVSIGGAILALRLLAEVRHCRVAMGTMALCCLCLAVPQAAHWNVLDVNSPTKWVAVTSAPLLAFTLLFISFGVYLRMLYREVREIENHDSLRDRFHEMRLRLFQRPDEDEETVSDREANQPKRRRWGRDSAVAKSESKENQETEHGEVREDKAEKQEPDRVTPSKPRRRWFGLRRAKVAPIPTDDSEADSGKEAEQKSTEKTPLQLKKKRRGLSVGRSSKRREPTVDIEDTESESASQPSPTQSSPTQSSPTQSTEPAPRRGWFGRKKPVSKEQESPQDSPPTDSGKTQSSDDAEHLDAEEVDWSSLNKSERRRLRKQMKRQNRAA